MKIKQTTKIVILVVALVSVIGVGAVSFAAWTGGAPSITASAQIGQIELYGFKSNSLTISGSLIPYDQTAGDLEGKVKIISVQLPGYVASEGNWQIKVTTTEETAVKLMASLTETAETAYTENAEGWTSLANGGAETVAITAGAQGADVEAADSYYLNLALDSSAITEMNQAIGLTIVFEKVAA